MRGGIVIWVIIQRIIRMLLPCFICASVSFGRGRQDNIVYDHLTHAISRS